MAAALEPQREQRIAFEVRFTVEGREVSFVTTHLHHQEAALRERQVAKLNDLFGKADRPVILAGDLNATPDSKAVGSLAGTRTAATADPALLTHPSANRSSQTGKFKTVREEEMAYFLTELRVDAVFTDNPDQFPRD